MGKVNRAVIEIKKKAQYLRDRQVTYVSCVSFTRRLPEGVTATIAARDLMGQLRGRPHPGVRIELHPVIQQTRSMRRKDSLRRL